jgi:autotransporter-associated beta strand protein
MHHHQHPLQRKALLSLCVLTVGLAPLSAATLYWDTNGSTSGLGGAGIWQDGSGLWSTDIAGTTPATWANVNRDTADFRGTGDAVTVGSGVSTGALLFNAGGYTLSGSAITLGRASGTGNVTVLNYASGTGANTISSNIIVDDVGTVGTVANYTFNNSGTGSLTFGGTITLNYGSGTPAGNKALVFQTGTSSASITLNGNIAQGANGGAASLLALTFGQGGSSQANAQAINGTFYVNGSNTYGRGTTISGGTVIVGNNSALGSGTISIGNSGSRGDIKLLTEGERLIANAVSTSGANTAQVYVGGNSAHESTFSGNFNLNGFGTGGNPGTISSLNPIFTAVAGGKVNFTGVLGASSLIPRGIIKQGAGIVSFNSTTGNTYKGATLVNEGTLLLMNTSGSATGDASQLAPGSVAVTVAANARLGGTGITTGLVGASAATSVFTPGGMTKEGVSSIGTLTLSGGLTATNGATFAFDVNGASVDTIHFGTGALDLDGVVTFDFTSLGTVQTGTAYSLFTGTGDWSSVAATFVFNGPAGYVLDTSYGSGNGYIFNADTHSLTVQFGAIPEPSTYALLAGAGLLAYAGIRRKGRRSAS